jgi:hypothetical protein
MRARDLAAPIFIDVIPLNEEGAGSASLPGARNSRDEFVLPRRRRLGGERKPAGHTSR